MNIDFKVIFQKKKTLLIILILLNLIVYSPVLGGKFLSVGDDVFIKRNPYVIDFDLIHGLSLFKKKIAGVYSPISFIFLGIQKSIFGLNPFIFHLSNLLLHLVVVCLLVQLAIMLGLTLQGSILAGLLFSFIPNSVETIAWISANKELLGAIFYLLSIVVYLKGNKKLSLFLALITMLSSVWGITIGFALLAVDRYKKINNGFTVFIPYFILSVLFLLINQKVMSKEQLELLTYNYLFVGHLFYIPLLGLVLITTKFLENLFFILKDQDVIIRKLYLLAIGLCLVGLMLIDINQSFSWKDSLSLWRYQSTHQKTPFVLNKLAQALREQIKNEKNNNEIIALYKESIKIDPKYLLTYSSLGSFYIELTEFDEALAVLNSGLKVNDKSTMLMLDLGNLYFRMNKPDLMRKVFHQSLKLDPDNEELYIQIIKTYGKLINQFPNEKSYQEEREEILSEYEAQSKRKKYSYLEYYNLGYLYEQVGGFEEAVRYYKKSLELKPSYEKSLVNLASIYQQTGDFKSALLVYGQLIHYHPKDSGAFTSMGIIFNALGDVDRAKMFYLKAIELNHQNAKPYFYLAYICESKGELKDALNYYEKSIEKDANQAEAYYNMGNVYAKLGQEAEAMASYLKTIGLDKNHLNAYINLSILSFKSREFANAIRYLEEARLLGYIPPEEYLKSLMPYRKK